MSTLPLPNPFLLSTRTHNLHFSLQAPLHPTSPLIVVIPGAGDVALSWAPVSNLLSNTSPVLTYDRSGLGLSERGPNRMTAENAAKELQEALSHPTPITPPTSSNAVDTAKTNVYDIQTITNFLQPPYILLAHSYGALVAREFLALAPTHVAGMLLIDPASETQHLHFRIPDRSIAAVLGDLNFARVTGLREECVLSTEEWRARAALVKGGFVAAAEEAGNYVEVCEVLGAKRQVERKAMGRRPLGVVRASGWLDYERIYEAGVKAGNGTEEERRGFRELLDEWEKVSERLQGEILGMGERTTCVYLEGCGHNVHLLRPVAIAEGMKWVLDEIKKYDNDEVLRARC